MFARGNVPATWVHLDACARQIFEMSMGRPPSNGGQGGFAETDGEGRLVRRWAACNEERFLSASIGSARLRHGDGQVLEVPENV